MSSGSATDQAELLEVAQGLPDRMPVDFEGGGRLTLAGQRAAGRVRPLTIAFRRRPNT